MLDKLPDDETTAKVNEAGAAIDDAITNPKPKPSVTETPGYWRGAGKSERRAAIKSGFKPDGVCEEPECSEPSTIELRYHRHGSEVNSTSLFHGSYCERHAKSNARLMARFGHRPTDGQEEYWVRPAPVWKSIAPKPPKQTARQKAAAAEVAAGAEGVKAEAEKETK